MSLTFSISYDTPHIYTSHGEQTQIQNSDWMAEIKEKFSKHEDSLNQLIDIRRWIKDTFTYESNQGATIGTLTADELYAARVWHGCHDLAHLFAATVRHIGYPCILVETTSVVWSKAYAKNPLLETAPQGHNLAEVYVRGKWVLFDPMSPARLEDYNYEDPGIPITDIYPDEPEGFYAIAKGKDCWDYGIRSLEDLVKLQKTIALQFFKC